MFGIKVVVGIILICFAARGEAASIDQIILGDVASEKTHKLVAQSSEIVEGALSQPARRLSPLEPASFQGGSIAFDLKIDPEKQNYVTAKFWGSDKGQAAGRLILFANDLQVGYRREGDYDVLNQCDEEGQAPNRFVYSTLPLPMSLTRGKSVLTLKISVIGAMWPYGTNFAQYQKTLTASSRGIYRVYVHDDARFVPDDSEVQGRVPESKVRSEPGEEVIEQSKQIVVDRLKRLLEQPVTSEKSGNQKTRAARLLLAGEAYKTSWTPAYQDARTIEQIVQDGDSMARDFAEVSDYASKDWPGAGPLGEAIICTESAIIKRLDESIDISGKQIQRRLAWADALRKSVDYWRTHRRSYTNQSMIVDWNIYTANRALQLIRPELAISQSRTMRFLYESIGIEPWLGSDSHDADERVADTPDQGAARPYGDEYFLVTRKGLSRELGWVATYGETILQFGSRMVELTGDQRIREQLVKLQRARLCFRYPALDAGGYSCMKLVSEIDNRTAHYPLSGSAYVSPSIREAWWMDVPALLSNDTVIVGAAQRSISDKQYFAYIHSRLKDADTLGMMRNVDQYEKVKSLPKSSYEFPMSDGQPDFVFADEEDAVIALKHGDTRLFINLYYRAERAVNGVARIFELTPTMTRVTTARTKAQTVASGKTYTRPDWIDGIRSKGMPPPGQEIHQAWAGEELPISARPTGAELPKYGEWGPFVGKAESYQLVYGRYFVVMNCSDKKPLTFAIPAEFRKSKDLVSGKSGSELEGRVLPPLSTVVLFAE